MTTAIIGGGAMGGLFASRMAFAGQDVRIFDKCREHVDAINHYGLKVACNGVTKSFQIPATTAAVDLGIVDMVMVFVKFRQTQEAMVDAAAMIGPDTLIVTLQNGIGNLDVIRGLYSNPVAYGLTTLTSNLISPGQIESCFDGVGETYVWSDDHGEVRCKLVRDAFKETGLAITVAPDIKMKIWQKLVVNGCLNPLCAISNLPVGSLVDQPGLWDLMDQIVAEICFVARHHGIPLDTQIGKAYLRKVVAEARHHVPSMLADVRARRDTEIDVLNGAIVHCGSLHRVETPLNTMLCLLVRALESGWSK